MPPVSSPPSNAIAAFLTTTAAAAFLTWMSRRPHADGFAGCVVVITGGSRGLGYALAREFAGRGARLALVARSADALDRAADRLRQDTKAEVATAVCDIRDRSAVDATIAGFAGRLGRIDVLVNNAGVIQVMPFEHAQDEDFVDSLATHFWGPLYLVRACLPYLARSRGRIVNITSIGGRVAVPHLLPYTVGKFAEVGLSEGLHAELGRYGISVTTVTPHLMQTGSHRNAIVRGQHEREATWFALGTASRATALDAERTARAIAEAARTRQSHLTVGLPAQAAQIAQALAPSFVAAVTAAVTALLLPGPAASDGDDARVSREIDVGPVARFFATAAARRLNQPIAADELAARQAAG